MTLQPGSSHGNLNDRDLALLAILADEGSVEGTLRADGVATYTDVATVARLALHELEKRSNLGLFDDLREWRRRTAGELGLPAYTSMPDRTLQAISNVHP